VSDVALPGEDTSPINDRERKLLARLLSDPTAYPASFKNWLIPFLEISDMSLPMTVVSGLQTRFVGIDAKISDVPVAKTRVVGGQAGGAVDASGQLVVLHGATIAPTEFTSSVVLTNNKFTHRHVVFSVINQTATGFTIASLDTTTHAPLISPEPIIVFWQMLIVTA
jgi:hypothetical protein